MSTTTQFSLALVTGSSSGIGEALSHLLADKGINLIIHGRDKDKLEKVAQELRQKVQVTIVQADLKQPEGRKKVVEIIHTMKPDLVVNNAGLGMYGEALSYETSASVDLLEVDGVAVLELSLEAARTLVSAGKKGVILNVSSAAAYPIFPLFAVYSASKAFVNQFSESFDEEMKPYGIRVLTACPGVVATNFRSRSGGKSQTGIVKDKVMTVDFAANEIWNQIQKGKKTHIFNWTYRLSLFFVRYLLPKSVVAKTVRKGMMSFLKPRPIIKLK